jgi:hypothetical protein
MYLSSKSVIIMFDASTRFEKALTCLDFEILLQNMKDFYKSRSECKEHLWIITGSENVI